MTNSFGLTFTLFIVIKKNNYASVKIRDGVKGFLPVTNKPPRNAALIGMQR